MNNSWDLIRGVAVLVIGLALILVWWPSVISIVKGGVGIALALIGMLLIHSAKR